MKDNKTILVSWFPFYHGLAFLKHVLAVFYRGDISPKAKKIEISGIIQEEAERIYDKKGEGFMFDKVIIFTPEDELWQRLHHSESLWKLSKIIEVDEQIKNSQTFELWKYVTENFGHDVDAAFSYVKEHYSDLYDVFSSQYWRISIRIPPSQQIRWLMEYSNLPEEYKRRFEFISVKKTELSENSDYQMVVSVTYRKFTAVSNKFKTANYFINLSLAPHSYLTSWFILSTAGKLPKGARFLETGDLKNSYPGHRFQKFFIKEQPADLISQLTSQVRLYDVEPVSRQRQIIQHMFSRYIEQGFAVLLLGERGIGKSYLTEKYANDNKVNFVAANCASFISSEIAESDLFGYKKGAFTGASHDREGLIEKADGGILFLDEIHTLPRDVQFKLMRALATDSENRMTIRRLGDTKEQKVRLKALILATNRTIQELRQVLLPDFFDRIAQLVIEMPPLRNTPEEIIPSFQQIWKQLRFDELGYDFPEYDNHLINWVKSLPLYGNYRDLQKIAINYKAYLDFPDDLKRELPYKNAYEFARAQFERYLQNEAEHPENKYFVETKTTEQMIREFKRDLANWLIKRFGSAPKAVNHLEGLGEKITKETLYNWRNYKEVKD